MTVIPLHGREANIASEASAPHSIEAEQQLIGTLLTSNDLYDRVASVISSADFYEAFHGRVFDFIAGRVHKNLTASPVTLAPYLAEDPAYIELGGPEYLAKLAGSSIGASAVRDYAQLIRDMAIRRELIALGKDVASKAGTFKLESVAQDQIVDAEARLYEMAEKNSVQQGFVSFLKAATDAITLANAAFQREGQLAGVSTGLVDLDKKLGGLHSSDLLILAGRPSMGKTSLATNIAFNVAKKYKRGLRPDGTEGAVDGGVVGFFSLEMSAEQLAARILSEAAEVPSEQIRRGDMSETEFRRFVEAAKDLESCPLYIDDTPAIYIAQLAARARRLKRTYGLDVLIVDYIQLVRGTSDNRVQEIAEISMGLKAIAKELNIPVIGLSQLSRQVESREDKRPQLSDLRESGSIEQDADVVMFVFREEYYKEREKPSDTDTDALIKWRGEMEGLHGRAEVIIGKQRHGPIGTVELSFEGQFTRFGNLARPWQQDTQF